MNYETRAMRDAFALAALIGTLASQGAPPFGEEDALANDCYALAEAMMAVREARPLPERRK
jgi:hypothetical protein